MGLDMYLKSCSREFYDSTDPNDFWHKEFHNSTELISWRKFFELNQWFIDNTKMTEECSDEIPKEKLYAVAKWLMQNFYFKESEDVLRVIATTDFSTTVIFYSCTY